MVGLGDVAGSVLFRDAWGVPADGSVVVGEGESASRGVEAVIWDASNGVRSLSTVLTTGYGFDLTGWTLNRARAVSDDGNVIVGEGINPAGQIEGWIATIPEPSSLLLLSLLGLSAITISRRRRGKA